MTFFYLCNRFLGYVLFGDDDFVPGDLEKNDHQDRNNQEGDDDSQPIPADEEAIQTLGNLMDLVIRQLGQPHLYFISGET